MAAPQQQMMSSAPQQYAQAPQQYAPQQYAPQQYAPQQQQQFAQPPPNAFAGASKDGGVSQAMVGSVPVTTVVYVTAGQMAAMTDVLNALGSLKGLWVSSWIDLFMIVTGWERNKRFKVRAWDPALGKERAQNGVTSEDIFKLKEDSDCCCRIFLGPARSFRMALYPYAEGQYPPKDADVFTLPGAVTLERPFRCTLGCLMRPVMYVRHLTVGYIAEIRNPWVCSLNYHFTIHAPTPGSDDMLPSVPLHTHASRAGEAPGTLWYRVRGRFCQAGMCCFLPFGPCKKVSFKIFAADDEAFANPIGEIQKVWKDCCTAITDADQFTIAFPPTANEVQRAAILASTILLEFVLFEGRSRDDRNNNNGVGGLLSLI